ncbi:ATP-binding cassette domain-containing protein [Streptomyces afghaniensis]|uniref:ATP-binding cassette domain-containing protein n=1 Tax=Streptomyces afghaniensis TaxID=66865 RepID=UPI0033BB41F7
MRDAPETPVKAASPFGPEPLVRIRGLGKRFGGTVALAGVDLDVHARSVLALLGPNGAGKSTLIKVLAGVHTADAGQITVDGMPLGSPAASRSMSFIHQDLGLVEWMTVAENIALTTGYARRTGLISWRRTRERCVDALRTVAGHLDPDAPVSGLAPAERSLVAIARALAARAKLIVLDEPTARLPAADSARLFGVLHDLRDRGHAILYVSHRLDEVYQVADTYAVLRDGRLVSHGRLADHAPASLVHDIVGEDPEPPATGPSPAPHPLETPATDGPPDTPATDGPPGTPPAVGPPGTPPAVGPAGTPAADGPAGTPAADGPVDTPASDHPAGTPAADRPVGVQPVDRSAVSPGAEGPAGVPPADGPAGASPAHGHAGTPAADGLAGAPAADRPAGTPAADRPVGVQPVDRSAVSPGADRPAGVPPADGPAGASPAHGPAGTPAADGLAGASASDRPVGTPAADRPAGAAAADRPTAASAADHPAGPRVAGAAPSTARPAKPPARTPPVLTLDGVRAARAGPVNLELGFGEVLGLVGLSDAGHTELGRALAGDRPLLGGRAVLLGRPYQPRTVAEAVARGVGFVPGDRLREGCLAELTVRENLLANPRAGGRPAPRWIGPRRERVQAAALIDRFSVRPRDSEAPIATLSGGNQQKVMIGRWLRTELRLLILEEPTASVDIGAKAAIHRLLDEALSAGLAVLLLSTDFEEVASVCGRTLVFVRGVVTAELSGSALTVTGLTRAASAMPPPTATAATKP